MDRLRDNIYTHLKAEKKPSIFVFDDLWHKDVLKRIGLRLLSHNSKNKIVVTTRDKGISNALGAEYTYHMKDLSEKESMELFCIHAFPKRKLPKDLESCGKDILNKCTRLPMAVEAMATQLNGVDKIPNHWKAALGRVNTEDVIKEKVMPTLRPSYNEMPPLLKACFLSFASFPPNTPIHVEWLVYSWLATFIEIVSAGGDAVDVARSYIDQLVDLCVIQALHVSADGRVKSCQMQEFFHGLAFSESENVAKCLLKPKKDLPYLPVEDCKDARRISLVKNEIIKITETIQCPKLRILLLFENVNLQSISKTFFKELRYLVVLDLSQTGIKSLPESIQYLKRLRFLNLSQTKIEKLPESLSGLRRLQFLDVSRCEYLLRLHSGVGEHTSLLHLNVKGCKKLLSLPSGISKLSSLLTLQLKGVVFDKKPVANAFRSMDLQALEGFPNLRHLSTTFTAGSISKYFLGASIWKSMTEMRVLSLQYDDSLCQRRVDIGEDRGVTVRDVCPIPTGLEFMERLEIIRLSKWRVLVPRPDWMFQLPNLTVLILDGDDSSSANDYKGLESIPNLRKLHLSGNKKCPEFPEEFGQRHAFPKLETLIIEDFNSLQKFPTLQPKAMPNLKRLQIINCRQMRDVPEGLERLKSLETLELDARLRENIHQQVLNSNRIKVRFREAMQKTERPPSGVSPTKNGCCQCIGKFSGNTRCCKCFG